MLQNYTYPGLMRTSLKEKLKELKSNKKMFNDAVLQDSRISAGYVFNMQVIKEEIDSLEKIQDTVAPIITPKNVDDEAQLKIYESQTINNSEDEDNLLANKTSESSECCCQII